MRWTELEQRLDRGNRQEQRAEEPLFDLAVPCRKPAEGAAVLRRPELLLADVQVARDASDRAVGRRVTAVDRRVTPDQTVTSQIEIAKRRASSGEREESRADVVNETRSRRFLRAERSPRTACVGLHHEDSE